MKFCNHTGNFLKYQPWTENHKLSLDDYCVVVGGLQRSNKYFRSVAVKFQGVLGAMYKGPEKEASVDFLEMKLFVDHLQERAGLPCRYGLKRQVLPVEPADLQLKKQYSFRLRCFEVSWTLRHLNKDRHALWLVFCAGLCKWQ